MNVSTQADKAFMAELQRNDPQRYDRLIKNMLREASRLAAQSKPSEQVELKKAA